MRLKDALIETRGAEWIRMTAQNGGLSNEGELNEIAQETAGLLLSPDVLSERMLVLHDEDIRFLNYVIQNGGRVLPAKVNYASADRLRNIDVAFVRRGSVTLELADEIPAAYAAIDTPEFHELRRKVSWLLDCLKISAHIHGIISISDLGAMYRRHPDRNEPNEELVFTLMRHVKGSPECPMEQKGAEFIVNGLAESGHEDKLRIHHEQVPAGIPSYSEMKDILQNGYPSKVKEYRALKKFLIRETFIREDYADAVLELIWNLLSSGNTYTEVMKVMETQAIPIPETVKDKLKPLLGDVWDVTRMLLCNGHTPHDVLRGQRDIFLGH